MRRAIPMFLLASLAFAGCKKSPTFRGVDLECTNDGRCQELGDTWRCYQSICIENSPPVLDALETVIIVEGANVSQEATAVDAEGDEITITWTAVGGLAESALPAPYQGTTLDVTTATAGIHTFLVVASDALSAGAAQSFTVVAQPAAGAIYVSKRGVDAAPCTGSAATAPETCGTFDAPCASVDCGLAQAQAASTTTVLLAANGGSAPYEECLDLDVNIDLLGCFDPTTWEHDSALRQECRIECGDSSGHVIEANATVAQVTFSIAPDTPPPVDPLTAAELPLVTLRIEGSSPNVDLVSVEAPGCGGGCAAVGVGSVNASATIRGLRVVGTVDDYDPLAVSVAIVIGGGAPALTSMPAADAPDDQVHPTDIRLNAPTLFFSGGILMLESAATLDGVEVTGGPATNLFGMLVFDGEVVIQNADLDLRGFGTQALTGITVADCAGDSTGLCDCSAWLTSAQCAALDMTPTAAPSITVVDSTIRLDSSSGETSLAPCAAIGMMVGTGGVTATVSNNNIEIGHNMTFSIGLGLEGDGDVNELARDHRVEGNTITIDDAETNLVCFIDGANSIFGELPAGEIAAMLFGTAGVTFKGNTISAGSHTYSTTGLAAFNTRDTTLVENDVTVGVSTSRIWTPLATGAILTGNTTATPSKFERNRVQIAEMQLEADGWPSGGTIAGTAVSLSVYADEDGDPTHPTWSIINNFIHGGGAVYAEGLQLSTEFPDPLFPQIAHNTIAGGSTTDLGATSIAFGMWIDNETDPGNDDTGVFYNNLLDAGDAPGVRRLLDNRDAGGLFVQLDANVGQFAPTAPRDPSMHGVRPLMAVPMQSSGGDGTFSPAGKATTEWRVLLAGAGAVLSSRELPAPDLYLQPAASVNTGGSPRVNPSGHAVAWMGRADGQDTVVVAVPHGLAVGRFDDFDGEFDVFPIFELNAQTGERRYLYPCAVMVADLDRAGPDDLLVAEGPECGPEGNDIQPALWRVEARRQQEGGGYFPPKRIAAVTLSAPQQLATTPSPDRFLIVDGPSVGLVGTEGGAFVDLRTRGVTTIHDVSTVSLSGMNGPGSAGDAPLDLTLVANNGVSVWPAIDPLQDLATTDPVDFPSLALPCTGAGQPIRVSVGDLVPDPGNRVDIAIACTTGAIDVYEYTALSSTLAHQTRLPPAPGDVALSIGKPGRTSATVGKLLVMRSEPAGGIDTLEAWSFNAAGAALVDEVAVLAARADVAIVEATTGVEHGTFFDAGFTVPGVLDTKLPTDPLCSLAYRSGGQPHDLSLVADDDCVDPGTTTVVSPDDIDGCGSRDADPDIGADELGTAANECTE